MLVRKKHGMNDPQPFAKELYAQIGRRIDQQVSFVQSQHNGAPRALVSRMAAAAHITAATDHRYTYRGAGSQHDQLTADVGGDESLRQSECRSKKR